MWRENKGEMREGKTKNGEMREPMPYVKCHAGLTKWGKKEEDGKGNGKGRKKDKRKRRKKEKVICLHGMEKKTSM